MAAYRNRLMAVACILVMYPFVATQPNLSRYQEFFPFFSWSLFSESPPIRNDVTLVISSIDGEELPEPTLIVGLPDRFPSVQRNIKFNKSIWHFAEAVITDNTADAEKLRTYIEQQHFSSVRSARYELALIEYDPLIRYRDRGAVKIVKSYRTFDYAN